MFGIVVHSLTILIVALLASMAFSFWCDRKYPRPVDDPDSPCALNHEPIILSAQPVAIEEHAAVILPYPHTAVLARCARCNNRCSYMMVGKWSVEELTLSEATAIKERTELERLARQ